MHEAAMNFISSGLKIKDASEMALLVGDTLYILKDERKTQGLVLWHYRMIKI